MMSLIDGKKKVYEHGIKINEQTTPRVTGDQEEFRYSLIQKVPGSKSAVYDNYTVLDGQDLFISAVRISTNITTNLQEALILRKYSDGTYYLFDGGYFLYSAQYILPVPYKIPAGDTLSMALYNNSGSEATFVCIFTGFTDTIK